MHAKGHLQDIAGQDDGPDLGHLELPPPKAKKRHIQ
jgi:hypothetical protein